MNPIQKRQKLDDEQTEKLFAELDEEQDKIEALDQEENAKVIEIAKQYNQHRKPHMHKRNEIISRVPDFWFTAFSNHPVLGNLIVEEDVDIFKYLESVEVVDSDDVTSGFKISMTFKKNPYFANTMLSKEYKYDDEGGEVKIIASPISWKKGKDPTAPGEDTKGGKRAASEVENISFFCWFGEEEEDELAEVFKSDFWTNPVKYFHNLVDEVDEDDEEGDEDEEGVEDEEGDEEEGDEEGGDDDADPED